MTVLVNMYEYFIKGYTWKWKCKGYPLEFAYIRFFLDADKLFSMVVIAV